MFYFVKTPWFLKKLYPSCIWDLPVNEKIIYLTFDDGPHPSITPLVLDMLNEYKAKATFFCIGKNVVKNPQLYKRILMEGHRVGNHTYNHVNGWKIADRDYLENIYEASKFIDSDLFRPPYGKISHFQIACLTKKKPNFKVIMWDVLSADFDQKTTVEKCISNVINNASAGSVVVFHDSEKASVRMRETLPRTLDYFSKLGYKFDVIR